jgi:hypothetical protein
MLNRLKAAHPYGPDCYRPGGCADIIRLVAKSGSMLASSTGPFRKYFPALCNSPFGGIAASRASTSATATGSMTGIGAKTSTVGCTGFATEFA